MKALLLVEDDDKALEIGAYVETLGIDVVRYRNPLKALDNLDEVAPHVIIASALDFPRHWKIIADVVRSAKSRQDCLIILMRGEHFSADEEAKATCLEVNAIVSEKLSNEADLALFLRLLRRFSNLLPARNHKRSTAIGWDGIVFLFSHPLTTRILGGKIIAFSASGLSLAVSRPDLVADLVPGQIIDDCRLRVGKRILSLRCSVVRAGNPLALAFPGISSDQRRIIEAYLAGDR